MKKAIYQRVLTTRRGSSAVEFAVIAFNYRSRVRPHPDPDSCATILGAVVVADHRAGACAYTDPGPHVSGAFVSGHQWSGMVTVTDSRMEVLKAGIVSDNPADLAHQSDPPAHVAVGNIVGHNRVHHTLLGSSEGNSGVAVVVHNAVFNSAVHPVGADAGSSEAPDVFMALMFTPFMPVLLP